MYHKIYFGEKTVILCDKTGELTNHSGPQTIIMHVEDDFSHTINQFLDKIDHPEFATGILISSSFEKLKTNFFHHFTTITASGGIVQNELNEILLIYRLKKWDLPKGKVEDGEDIAASALREVQEETGLKKMELQKKIGETYHTYKAFGKYFLKTTHWFYITCHKDQSLQPQLEENIETIKWVSEKKLPEIFSNTYPSIIDILTVFAEKK